MDDHASLACHRAVPFLIGLLAAFCLAVPVSAGFHDESEEKDQASKVAKKMKKAQDTAHRAEEERDALRHFQEAVADYAQLHAKQLARLGTQESAATQRALARTIAVKRAKASPGDLFRPEVEPLFRRLIAEQLEGPDALAARKAVLEGNPEEEEDAVAVPVPVAVRVNAVYPPGAPRSTVPASVLLTLPPLPESLHYRFVGRDLLLVDSVAQLIVDFLPAAAPDLAVK